MLWVSVADDVEAGMDAGWRDPGSGPGTLAFLQYTSGSTANPKGVMVSHGNLLHNLAAASARFGISQGTVGVSWLPPYHDMGLIGCILQTAHDGCSAVLMPPIAFLQRPARWLKAISRYRGTATATA